MISSTPGTFNSLFWRLSAVFIFTLLVFASISMYMFIRSTHDYTTELNQSLNLDLAEHTVKEISPFIVNGEVNQEGMGAIMHSMMTINPSVEVYILNNEGKILSYVAPYKEVKLEKVGTGPIEAFIQAEARQGIIEGDDPRNPGEQKIFSAAPIFENEVKIGYVYIVLASQTYVSATRQVLGSYILSLTFKTVLGILLTSLALGMLAFWFFTKRLNKVVATMQDFKAGQLESRLEKEGGKEFSLIADTFNEMADTLQKNIEQLKGVDKLRKELISNISHDLRTPIASIQGYAETLELKQGQLSHETEAEYLDVIVKNCKRLSSQVEGLFELSKLESGQIEIHPTPFSIAELVHDVAAKYRLISQKRGISINTILEKNSPQVVADISLIDRVLQNLIDNAIKFCSEGDYINIEIDTAQPEKVMVRIADSGQGIPKDHLDKIFNRMYTNRTERNSEGSGLGLSIVKRIIDLHGGEISVQSQLNAGSVFTFTLPKAA